MLPHNIPALYELPGCEARAPKPVKPWIMEASVVSKASLNCSFRASVWSPWQAARAFPSQGSLAEDSETSLLRSLWLSRNPKPWLLRATWLLVIQASSACGVACCCLDFGVDVGSRVGSL